MNLCLKMCTRLVCLVCVRCLLFTDEVCVYIQAHETLCTLRFSSLISQCELGKATKHISLDKDSEVRHATKSYFSRITQDVTDV